MPGAGPPWTVTARQVVVADQCRRPDDDPDLEQAAQRHHLAFLVADIDAVDVVDVRPIRGLGLHLHLPGPAEQVHVVDVISAERCLKRLEDGVQRHAEDLNLVPVNIEVDRRVRGREGAEHAAQSCGSWFAATIRPRRAWASSFGSPPRRSSST